MRFRSDVNHLLPAMPEPFSPLDRDLISARLAAGRVIAREIHVFSETDSTNDLARRAGDAGAAEGLVFFAETQRAGRGRRGRAWASRAGSGLWFSTVLRPRAAREKWPRLTLLAVRAVLESLARVAGVTAVWKWPNDVMVGSRKLAGILVEATPDFAVLGIGLNVRQRKANFPAELRDRAVSVEMITGSGIDREALAAAILSQVDRWYQSDWAGWEFVDTFQFCLDRAALQPPREVRVFSQNSWINGILVGYTDDAHLRVEHSGREQIIREGLLEEGGGS